MLITGAIIGAALLGGGYFAWHHFHVKHRLAAVEKAVVGKADKLSVSGTPVVYASTMPPSFPPPPAGPSFSVPSSLPANTTSPAQPVINLPPAA